MALLEFAGGGARPDWNKNVAAMPPHQGTVRVSSTLLVSILVGDAEGKGGAANIHNGVSNHPKRQINPALDTHLR